MHRYKRKILTTHQLTGEENLLSCLRRRPRTIITHCTLSIYMYTSRWNKTIEKDERGIRKNLSIFLEKIELETTGLLFILTRTTFLSVLSVGACWRKKRLGKRSRDEDSSMDPESKRARLDESTSNQVAPEPVPEVPRQGVPSRWTWWRRMIEFSGSSSLRF